MKYPKITETGFNFVHMPVMLWTDDIVIHGDVRADGILRNRIIRGKPEKYIFYTEALPQHCGKYPQSSLTYARPPLQYKYRQLNIKLVKRRIFLEWVNLYKYTFFAWMQYVCGWHRHARISYDKAKDARARLYNGLTLLDKLKKLHS